MVTGTLLSVTLYVHCLSCSISVFIVSNDSRYWEVRAHLRHIINDSSKGYPNYTTFQVTWVSKQKPIWCMFLSEFFGNFLSIRNRRILNIPLYYLEGTKGAKLKFHNAKITGNTVRWSNFWCRKFCLNYFLSYPCRKSRNINPLNTKRRLLYLKTQFVPRSKHFSSRL